MKYCRNCGSQHDDNVGFCSHCGGRLENNQPPVYNQVDSNHQGQTTQNSNYAQPYQSKPILSRNPVLNKVKGLATTPLFLVSIIIYSVLVFVRFINVFATRSLMTRLLENNYATRDYSFGRMDSFAPFIGNVQGVFIVFSLLAMIPCILICIGLWMFYSSSTTYENRSTSGLTLIKISTIINFVAILAIPICIIFISMTVGANRGYPIRGLFGLLFLTAIVYILPIMYYLSILKTINQIRATIITGIPTDMTSIFLIVMNYIIVGISIIGMLSSRGASILVVLLNAAFLIMISIGLYEYKKEMLKLIYQSQYANNAGYRSGI